MSQNSDHLKLLDTAKTKEELVAELEQTRKSLSESENKYQTAIHAHNEGIVYQLADGSIQHCNKSAEIILGLTADQMRGRTSLDPRWKSIHEDGSPFPGETHPMVHTLSTGVACSDVIMGIHHPDGELRWISINCNPLFRDGEKLPYAAVGSMTDITERKRAEAELKASEERFRMIYENAPVLINAFDENGRCVLWNKQCQKTFGWTVDEINASKDSLALFYPDPTVRNEVLRTVTTEPEGRFREWHPRTKNGKTLMTMWANFRLPDGIAFNLGYDITGRRQMEMDLEKNRKLESVGVLAGGIAHDFNNILTGLFGNIELAKLKLQPDNAAYTYIQTAHKALERASSLTKQLLTFAKGGDPILQTLEITQVIQDSVEFTLSGSNVRTVLNLPENLWQVKADKGQVSQVIANLVINADQAMPNGGTLIIKAENLKDIDNGHLPYISGDFVKLSIRDHGPGISEELKGKIFDPYITTKASGSGLGLTVVHSIISKHNGHINVDSQLGFGATFVIYLPADRSPQSTNDEPSSSVSEKSPSKLKHILVMDDDEMILDLSTHMLESFGYTSETAMDGEKAVEKYVSARQSGNPFDVAIVDLTIPGGIGGREVVEKLLTIDPDAKIIVSSGYSTDPVMANYSTHGFKGRIVKPFRMADLKNELSRVLEQG